MKDQIESFLNLDLVQYAYKAGYSELKSGKESKTWISLKNPSTGDHIRIKTRPFPMHYNNNDANLSQDRGNIINFVINRLDGLIMENPKPSKEMFAAAFKILREETGDIMINDIKLNFKKSEDVSITEYAKTKIKNIQDCTEYSVNYLEKIRLINPSVLENPLFIGKIKESPVPMENKKVIGNICFVKTDLDDKITGIVTHYHSSKKNENIKRVYELKDNIWISNRVNNPKNLIYGESAIDCLSHYEINNPKSICYASTEGEASPEKLKNIFNLYNNLKENSSEATITSITDNDYQGNNYDLKLALFFYNQINVNNPIERIQENNLIKYVIHGHLNGVNLTDLKEKMLNLIRVEAPSNHKLFTPYLNLVETKDYTIITVPYKEKDQKISHFLKPLTTSIHKLNNIKYFNHKSNCKDWNEDLQNLKKKEVNLKMKNKFKI